MQISCNAFCAFLYALYACGVMGCCQFLYFAELINNSNFFVDQFAFVTTASTGCLKHAKPYPVLLYKIHHSSVTCSPSTK